MATIMRLTTEGEFREEAVYTCEPKKALVAFIEQQRKNFNTWMYPEEIKGMKQLPISKRWSFIQPNGDVLYVKE